jgi:NADH-quinone oxidoreductase subunit D
MPDLVQKNPAALNKLNGTGRPDAFDDLNTQPMRIQFGPSHPATHGTVRIELDLEGERVVNADVQVGYLHRGFEKECETGFFYQNIPYTDRLNYSSAILNNVGYCLAIEKLFDITTPPRCQFIRVIGGEISRIADHLLAIGSSAMELAAFTPMLYLLEGRDLMYDLTDALCGARVTTNFVRIGGISADLPDGFKDFAIERLDRTMKLIDDADRLLTENPIFRERTEGTGHMPAKDLLAWGVTGPILRAGGIPYDVRRVTPYLVYDQIDFDVPVGEHSDNFDRYLVRMEEMRQSRRMIVQCLDKLPDGAVNVDDPRVRWPAKGRVFSRMEELIDQFKLVLEGGMPPAGEVYHAVEGASGELGFYIVSDGTGKAWKCRCRAPSFSNMSPLKHMLIGGQLADVVPTFGLMNMIGGECDR